MKNMMFIFAMICMITTSNAQKFEDIDKSPMDVTIFRSGNNETLARVIYSRPQKKSRKIFGKLVEYGKVWRTGANEATEITLYHDMSIGEKKVPAGTYTLYTVPGETEWTIILNKDINVWGAYNYDESKDVARVVVPVKSAAAPIEAFSMTFLAVENGAKLMMGWDEVYVEIPLIKA